MYLPAMGMFIDNQDMTRFATLNSSTAAMLCGIVCWFLLLTDAISHRNALTFSYFMPGIPIVFYGTEQQATGWLYNNSNRTPMWTYGFDESTDVFTWIRMLNWYASTA